MNTYEVQIARYMVYTYRIEAESPDKAEQIANDWEVEEDEAECYYADTLSVEEY